MAALEARLRFFFVEGVTNSLKRLGWIEQHNDKALVFTKKVGEVHEVIALRRAMAFTHRLIEESLGTTRGITYGEFETAYIETYQGKPPLMPL